MPLDAKVFAALEELLEDARPCPRLSDWDERFLAELRGRVARFGPELRLSEAQASALKRIEGQVYAYG